MQDKYFITYIRDINLRPIITIVQNRETGKVGFSICRKTDKPNKKLGQLLAIINLNKGINPSIPNLMINCDTSYKQIIEYMVSKLEQDWIKRFIF